MKKLLLAFIATISLSSAIAQSGVDTNITTGGVITTFELEKADINSGIFTKNITPYQQCIMNCLAIYGTWDERGLGRCLANCGV